MTSANINILERLGLQFLHRGLERGDTRIHRLSRGEMDEIRRIERRVIALAAGAGALSGGVLGAAEIALYGRLVEETGASTWSQQLPYWWRYLTLSVLVSAVELLAMYWTILRAVARIGSIAGLRLSGQEIEDVIALGLSRAALDLPNPRMPIHGIDPYARVSRWRLALLSVVYRMKVGATTFAVRLLLRRIIARGAVRLASALAAIPVFAIWNALIARWIIREARFRAAGPIAVQELGDVFAACRGDLDAESRHAIVAAVGESVVCAGDAHPNFILLVPRLLQELEVPREVLAEWDSTRDRLPTLPARAQDILLATLTTATLLGGSRRAQRKLLAEAYTLCGRPFDVQALRSAMDELLDGQGLGTRRALLHVS
jgi:hypothetical protein